MTPTVLLSTADFSGDEPRRILTDAGIAVVDHRLGSTPPVDFTPLVAAIVDVPDGPDAAVAQTRRWRAELGDCVLPIIWIVHNAAPDAAARGLDAGADAIVTRLSTRGSSLPRCDPRSDCIRL